MSITFYVASTSRAQPSNRHNMDRRIHLAGSQPGEMAHCSSPPLQAAFRLPRLPRDVEAVTRPRAPLFPVKWEEASETYAVIEFGIGRLDEVAVKVEAEEVAEAPVDAEEERGVRAQFASLRVAPPAAAKRAPGRPKGSRSRPRVQPQHDKSAPPEREEARKATARIAAQR